MQTDRILRDLRRFAAAARPVEESDRTLLDRFARSRDEPAFAELVRRHGPMVLGVCRRVLRHSADADDAFQAAFLILVRRAGQLRDPDRLGAWLFGVAWRVANKLRTSRRHGTPLSDELAACSPAEPADWPVELDAAIARLPEKYRTPIVLCHLQGLSPAEAARRLGCPPATVATRLFRARNTLRRKLTALGLAVPTALVADSVLHVPAALAAAAHGMAAGRSIPPAVGRLADGALRSVIMTKIRWAATAAAVCLTGVGVVGFQAGGQEPPTGATSAPPIAAVAPPPSNQTEATTVKTANFRVTAPSARVARLIADAAERARKEVASAWLGRELPTRSEPCRIKVNLGHAGSGGATTFNFDGGRVTAEMTVEGPLDRLLADVIPHEVTHVVMAEYFKKSLPRWADEGIAMLSESEEEQARYPSLVAQARYADQLLQVKALLAARDYPSNVGPFFAQSYCLARVLVDRKDRKTLLSFVKDGVDTGWEAAAKTHYGATLDELEQAMIEKAKAKGTAKAGAAEDTLPRSIPTFALATADPSGQIKVFDRVAHFCEPVTSYVQRTVQVPDSTTLRTYMEPVTNYRLRTSPLAPREFEAKAVKAATPQGKPVEEAKLLDALKGKTVAVVLVTDADKFDKKFADLLKPDTIILIVPAEKAPMTPPPSMPPPEGR
jgi:RNA polymerase sigma factor (sigma-70 family)